MPHRRRRRRRRRTWQYNFQYVTSLFYGSHCATWWYIARANRSQKYNKNKWVSRSSGLAIWNPCRVLFWRRYFIGWGDITVLLSSWLPAKAASVSIRQCKVTLDPCGVLLTLCRFSASHFIFVRVKVHGCTLYTLSRSVVSRFSGFISQ